MNTTTPASRSLFLFLAWLAAVAVVAVLGALASIEARTFYATLTQPTWAPPGWLFGPVWSTLYLLMAFAAWKVSLLPPSPRRTRALVVFGIQLVANALWSWLFFAWHLGALASIEVLVLLALIAWTLRLFNGLQRAAAWLLAPYLAWVGFASVLCWTMWQLNPGAL